MTPASPIGCLRTTRRIAQRRGVTLVETVGLVLVIGLLLGLSASVLNQAFRVHRDSLYSFRQLQQMQIWAERFRSDVHAAAAVDVQAEQITLTRPGGTQVSYQLKNTGLVRQATDGEQLLASNDWSALGVSRAQWSVDRDKRYPLVRCQLTFVSSAKSPFECVARVRAIAAEPITPEEPGDAE